MINNQTGMSFIEAIVSSLLVAVLAAVSVNTFNVYLESTYNKHQGVYITNLLSSLQAGRIEYDTANIATLESVEFHSDGTPPTAVNTTVDDLLPGFNAGNQLEITVVTNPRCINGADTSPCILDDIYVHHCKSNVEKRVTRFDTDIKVEQEYTVSKSC